MEGNMDVCLNENGMELHMDVVILFAVNMYIITDGYITCLNILFDFFQIDHKNGKRYGCRSSIIVNCAGPWAGQIAKMAGIGEGDSFSLPVEPR